MKFALSMLLVFFAVTSPLQAQNASTETKSFVIPKVENEIQLDGVMSPGEWDQAVTIEDFHEIEPVEFEAPQERTVYYLMYTEDALLVAVYSYEDPTQLTASVLRHGVSLRNDERVQILLDPFNNKRSGYVFQTNPNGVRQEGIYTGDSSISFEWTGIWDTAASAVADGWIAEMRIPFKTLSFNPDNQTWGVNFTRDQTSTQSRMGWVSRNGRQSPNNSGVMTGLTGLNQGMGLDITPSLSSTYADNVVTGDRSETNPSLDMNYKVTPSLDLTLTMNTDFAATEVDSIQLDLGRFSTRLQEKRAFFLAGMDIFSFVPRSGGFSGGAGSSGPDPFFSRNIGIYRGQPVDLIAGAKLSGRVAGYDVGALVIRQDEVDTVDATDLFVGRIKRSIFNESEIGLMYTNGDPASNDETSTLGVDYTYRTRFGSNRSLDAEFWVQKSDNPGIDSDDMAWNVHVNLPSRNSWYAAARVQEVQENYDPRLGFSNRTGVRHYAASGGNYWIFRGHPWLQQVQAALAYTRYDYLDTGDLQSSEWDWNLFRITAQSGDEISADIKWKEEVLRPGDRAPLARLGVVIPAGEYEFTEYSFMVTTVGSRSWDVRLRGDFGDYYTGEKLGLAPVISWRPNRHLSFSLNYNFDRYEMPDATVYTRVISFTNEIAFSPSLSLVNLIQYENVSDSVGFNSRFRWNIRAGQDVWFVLGHNMEDPDEDGDFTRVETSASAKISYTLRY